MLKQYIEKIKQCAGDNSDAQRLLEILNLNDFASFPEAAKQLIYEDIARTIHLLEVQKPRITKLMDDYKEMSLKYEESQITVAKLIFQTATATKKLNKNVDVLKATVVETNNLLIQPTEPKETVH